MSPIRPRTGFPVSRRGADEMGYPAITCLAVGGAALLIGAIIYEVARPMGLRVAALDSAPAFIHVFAMTLLMSGLLRPRGTAPWLAAGWIFVDALFELGQHPDVAPAIAARLDAACGPWPVCTRTANYFLSGTFDFLDLLAAALGGLAALRVLGAIERRGSLT